MRTAEALEAEPDDQEQPADKLDPRQKNRTRIEKPVGHESVVRRCFRKLSRIGNLAHAGIEKEAPHTNPEGQRQIPARHHLSEK